MILSLSPAPDTTSPLALWLGGDQAPLNDSDMADEEIDTEIPDEVAENLTEPAKPPAPIPDPGPL
ncbi:MULTISPECIES: hypothetical protein [Pseudomonas]|uniref:Uncharacterized protein n=1 Tax=Pseudomonas oryzihabitans TaxID=47885 RepID=A0A2Z5ACN8_9PSED|nr:MULTISPECIES: hypothetical protein [Pseudomonas]AXA67091.1 hypothetical protein CE139_15120 [Pseudomonas oryzihabitans]